MNDAFEKNMALIAGANDQKKQEKALTDADKKKISSAYMKLFYSLSFAHWMRGISLGQAWYKALEQTKAFIASKSSENPATMYMRQIFAAHKAQWSKRIMTSPNKDKILNCPPEKKQEWNMRIAKNTNGALKTLNDTLALYAEKEQKNQKPAQQSEFLSAQQKMQMLLMWQAQNQRQHVA